MVWFPLISAKYKFLSTSCFAIYYTLCEIRDKKSTCTEQILREKRDLEESLCNTQFAEITCKVLSKSTFFSPILAREVIVQWAQNKNRGTLFKANIVDMP